MTNNNLTNNLTISRENAIAAYDNTNDAGRKLLENLFGKEVFAKDITERVKTFEDACNVLGDDHPLVKEYCGVVNVDLDITQDLIAYLKLRIITAVLNEGWEPQFTEDEWHYFPWFQFFTQKEINEMGASEKACVIIISHASYNSSAYVGLTFAHANTVSSYSGGQADARLAFKTRELAEYAGRQFIRLYADFIFPEKV